MSWKALVRGHPVSRILCDLRSPAGPSNEADGRRLCRRGERDRERRALETADQRPTRRRVKERCARRVQQASTCLLESELTNR